MAQPRSTSIARIRRLTQLEEPALVAECEQLRDELVRDHAECLRVIDLFNGFLRRHCHLTLLAEDRAFSAAIQTSQKHNQKQDEVRAAIATAWGDEEADYFIRRQMMKGTKPASLTTLKKLKTIARGMTLAKFKSLANALLLVRHREAVKKFHERQSFSIPQRPRLTDDELDLIRDHGHDALVYCGVQITDVIQDDVAAWICDTDGSAKVDHRSLKDCLEGDAQVRFHMLQLDDHGLLVQRRLPDTPSPLSVTPLASTSRVSAVRPPADGKAS